MKLRSLFFIIFVFYFTSFFGQAVSDKAFESFAMKQDSLFIKAYEQRDTTTYQTLLYEFLNRYNQLTANEQSVYKNSLQNAYYNLCCTYALLNNKPMALLYLQNAIEAGYVEYAHIQEDNDLNSIRKEPQFATLLQPLREVGDYLYILKKDSGYNNNDNRKLPQFTYQTKDNEHLQQLKHSFNLDSIAGSGNEVSQIINLMHWVHNLIPHDGNHGNPEVMNAMNLIAVCKRDNRGLNCRGLATVLNECYLSLGIPSRFVTCLPKDSLGIDPDCHVINAVYVNSLQKWIWIDPTNDAYVMNEKGELLSIEEVRNRLLNDKPLLINPDANWNHKVSKTKQDYLYSYMAKNLYGLECAANSEYDAETQLPQKQINSVYLLPVHYFKTLPDKNVYANKKSGTSFITHYTNNAAAFWQAPEQNQQP